MNPYAVYLGGRDPLEIVSGTSKRLELLLGTIGSERAEKRPAPGKWSAREILCHLADCELVFAFRLRQALAEAHHVVQPFDQEVWARTYGAYGIDEALAVFSSVRNWNLAFIRTLTPEALSKQVTHPERGTMPLQAIVETMAGHDVNHLGQMEAIGNGS